MTRVWKISHLPVPLLLNLLIPSECCKWYFEQWTMWGEGELGQTIITHWSRVPSPNISHTRQRNRLRLLENWNEGKLPGGLRVQEGAAGTGTRASGETVKYENVCVQCRRFAMIKGWERRLTTPTVYKFFKSMKNSAGIGGLHLIWTESAWSAKWK